MNYKLVILPIKNNIQPTILYFLMYTDFSLNIFNLLHALV